MAIYLFVAGYLVFFALVQSMGKEKVRGLYNLYGIICFLIFLIAGCRYGLETDYWHYNDIFNGNSEQTVETGFLLLIKLVKLFTNNFNFFLVIVAALSFGTKAKLMGQFKYCFLIMLSYYLKYYVLFELNAIRQGLSLAIVLIAVTKLVEGNKKKFVILALIASTIHASSAFILLALLFEKKTLKPFVLIGMLMG